MADHNDRHHTNSHRGTRVIICRKCNRECRNRDDLHRHLRERHYNRHAYHCRKCPYSSVKSSNLKRHEQNVHRSPRRRVRHQSPLSRSPSASPPTQKIPTLRICSTIHKPGEPRDMNQLVQSCHFDHLLPFPEYVPTTDWQTSCHAAAKYARRTGIRVS